jgi:hypothetical protein
VPHTSKTKGREPLASGFLRITIATFDIEDFSKVANDMPAESLRPFLFQALLYTLQRTVFAAKEGLRKE